MKIARCAGMSGFSPIPIGTTKPDLRISNRNSTKSVWDEPDESWAIPALGEDGRASTFTPIWCVG